MNEPVHNGIGGKTNLTSSGICASCTATCNLQHNGLDPSCPFAKNGYMPFS